MAAVLRDVCAFTPICEADSCWVDQYLHEAERIGLRFVVHLDRCSDETRRRMTSSPMCHRWTEQTNPEAEYHEQYKQVALDIVHSGFLWALHWDVDETWEPDARDKLGALPIGSDPEGSALDVRWVCLWGDDQHARVDEEFSEGRGSYTRTKLYRRVVGGRWEFLSPLVYGPTMVWDRQRQDVPTLRFDLACLHHGYKTRELRLLHKERWDRIYGGLRDDGKNPYGMWELLCDEAKYPPTIERHGYL